MPFRAIEISADSIERPAETPMRLENWKGWFDFFPEADSKAYVSLALAYETVKDRACAESALQKGKRLFPGDQLLRKFSLKN